MAKCRVLIVFICINYAISLENSTQQHSSDKPIETTSFMSRIANWIFPFGGGNTVETTTDSITAEGRFNNPRYLPPPPLSGKYQSTIDIDCNPCNRVPWIPIFGRSGKNTIINFAPPSSHGSLSDLQPPPSQQYGPPLNSQYNPSLDSQYGPPPSPPPLANSQYLPPKQQYNPLPEPQYAAPPPSPQYLPVPELQRVPPPSSQYGQVLFRPRPPRLQQAPHILSPPPPPPPQKHRPVQNYGVPGMLPPPINGNKYHSLPFNQDNSQPPPIRPLTDSYGAPVTGPNANYLLPPIEQLSSSSDHQPIPLPNLSSRPVLPIHNYKNFHETPSATPTHNTISDIQIVPSVNVADFVSSIEHPINVIQSPLLDVAVKENQASSQNEHDAYQSSHLNENASSQNEHIDIRPGGIYESTRLSENPIIVDDTQTSASIRNASYQNIDHNRDTIEKNQFTQPQMNNEPWSPSWGGGAISTSMVPPPLAPPTWLTSTNSANNLPKQVQIIVPYINTKSVPDISSTLTPPPQSSEELIWTKFIDYNSAESKRITATAFTSTTTPVSNIIDILKDSTVYQSSEKLPFDVISLQNHIDNWTQQQYSKRMNYDQNSDSITKLVPSKQIPNEYFNAVPFSDVTTTNPDYQAASSDNSESKLHKDIETNLIIDETTVSTTEVPTTTPVPFSLNNQDDLWKASNVTISPITKEKVYIVTPQPIGKQSTTKSSTIIGWSLPPKINAKIRANESSNIVPKFLIRIDPENDTSRQKLLNNTNGPSPLTVVFSEWPHLINNLQTTTTTEKPSTSRNHPLLGLMGIQAYTPPPNSTVQTISGHSKVVTVVTPGATTKVHPLATSVSDKTTLLKIVTPSSQINNTTDSSSVNEH